MLIIDHLCYVQLVRGDVRPTLESSVKLGFRSSFDKLLLLKQAAQQGGGGVHAIGSPAGVPPVTSHESCLRSFVSSY